MKFSVLLFFIFTSLCQLSLAQVCNWQTQRPQADQEFRELIEIGRELNPLMQPMENLTATTNPDLGGAYNLSVLSLEISEILAPLVLKIGSAEPFNFVKIHRKRSYDRIIEYTAVHKSLADMQLAPQLHAIIVHEDLSHTFSQSEELQNTISLRYENPISQEVFDSEQRIGFIMEQLFNLVLLSRNQTPPPWMSQWCESHVVKALEQMIEMRKRVIEAGILLEDKQLTVNDKADVYLIDIDFYSFNGLLAARNDFMPEARELVRRWEISSGNTFNLNTWEQIFRRLNEPYSPCSRTATLPLPNFRSETPLSCDNNEETSTALAYVTRTESENDEINESLLDTPIGPNRSAFQTDSSEQTPSINSIYRLNFSEIQRAANVLSNLNPNIELKVQHIGAALAIAMITRTLFLAGTRNPQIAYALAPPINFSDGHGSYTVPNHNTYTVEDAMVLADQLSELEEHDLETENIDYHLLDYMLEVAAAVSMALYQDFLYNCPNPDLCA